MKNQTIKNDFLLKNLKNSLNLNFLRKVSKSPVFISKDTGLVYHSDILSSKETVRR